MAGPWEEFQRQDDGPWSQFQSAAPVTYTPPPLDSLKTSMEAYDEAERARRAGDNAAAAALTRRAEDIDASGNQTASFAATFGDLYRSAKQAPFVAAQLTPWGIANRALLPGVRAAGDKVYDDLKAEQAEADRVNDPLYRNNRTGQVLGYATQILGPGLLAKGLQGARAAATTAQQVASPLVRALLPDTVRGAALQGGALGAAQPLATGEGEGTRAANATLGTVAGAGGQALAPVVGATVRGARSLIQPFTQEGRERIVGGLLRRFAADPSKVAAPLADPVTGMAPTLAEATLDPGIAQLQRAATAASHDVASAITLSRQGANQTRMGLLRGFLGSDGEREAIEAGVKQAEDAAYGSLRQADGVDVAPVVSRIEGILSSGAGKREAVRSALGKARDALFKADGTPETSVDALLGARQNIGDLLTGMGDNGAGKLASTELIAVREALDDQIRRVTGGGLDAALDARRVGMRPVNEMDTVRGLLANTTADVPDASGGLLRGFNAPSFIKATDDFGFTSGVDRAARQATGFRRATADNTLGPAATNAIDDVRLGLLRQVEADRLAKVPGSPTAQFMAGQNIMDSIAGPLGMREGGWARGVLGPLVEGGAGRVYSAIGLEDRLQPILAEALTNPQRAAQIIGKLPPRDRALVEAAIAPYIRSGALTGAAVADN
jgi:hypothetical protein